jgi:hypothetical protein
MVTGSAYGVVEGLRHPAATSARLKLNTVLNAVQKRGPFLGNTLGVIGASRAPAHVCTPVGLTGSLPVVVRLQR